MQSNLNFKIAIRNIIKNKVQSTISIIGLGIGLGSIILLALLFLHENSYNKHVPNHQQVFRVLLGDNCSTPYPLADEALNDIPEIESSFRIFQNSDFEIRDKENSIFQEKNITCSDSELFDIFGIEFISGKPAQSRSEIAISAKMAKKYFKELDPTGHHIEVRLNNEFIRLTISGVYHDFPTNSTLNLSFVTHTDLYHEFLGKRKKMLGEFGNESEAYKYNWENHRFQTYLKLKNNYVHENVESKLQYFTANFKDEKNQNKNFILQAVSDIYLKSPEIGGDFISKRGNADELKYYLAIAAFILALSMANYIYLNKAKVNMRLRELGAKKALGAPSQLILRQIIMESNLVAFVSLIPAALVVLAGIPFINNTLSINLDLSSISLWSTALLFIMVTLVTGTVSGLLIGAKISRISSVLLLNRKTHKTPCKAKFAHSFLTVHFAIFLLLIISVITVKKQVNYALTNFKAINPENVMICELNSPELSKKIDVIQNEISQIPGVIQSAGSSFVPPFNWTIPLRLKYDNETVMFDGLIMGQGMTNLLQIEYIEGGPFGEFGQGTREIIFNESAAKKYNLKAGELFNGFMVKGIVKDFTAHTLRELIRPMAIIQQHPKKMRLLAIKTDGSNDDAIISRLTTSLKTIAPDKVVNIYSLKEQIDGFYTSEKNQGRLISAFSILAIILCVMGLLGMVLNTIAKNIKEIGIRKVNGARTTEILVLLNYGFLKWIVLAIVIATPASWFIMQKWLENFAYKTELSWWIFALAGLLALGIALLTVSWQSWRAATRNPVESLRYE